MSKVKRQLMAVIDERTTIICLDAAGQVVGLHEPFRTLNGDQWEPPFHVHCRSIVVPYVPGSTQVALARREQARRPASQYRSMPPMARKGLVTRLRDLLRTIAWSDKGSLDVLATPGTNDVAVLERRLADLRERMRDADFATRVKLLDEHDDVMDALDVARASQSSAPAETWRLGDEPMSTLMSRDPDGAKTFAARVGDEYTAAVARGLPDDVTARLEYSLPSIVGKVRVEVRLYQAEREVGRLVREIDVEKGAVEHDLFKLRKGVRGRGIGRRVTDETMALYAERGIDKVYVHANIDVGGYAWARLGFTWDTERMAKRDVEAMIRSAMDACDDVPDMTAGWRSEVMDTGERMIAGLGERWPEPAEVAMLGWRAGTTTWPGKEGMLRRSWMGVRYV